MSDREERTKERTETHACDLISRRAAVDALDVLCQEHRYKIPGKIETYSQYNEAWQDALDRAEGAIFNLPSAQPERVWTPCDIPPEHHRDVIVRGIEAIGNVTVHKVMQWDVDTWRPTDYAPSVMWKEWSEI